VKLWPAGLRIVVRNPMRSLYSKIFLWFLATVVGTAIVTIAVASLTGSQPFGRRWMAITQDLYAHSAVDFYQSGGAPALSRYLDTLAVSSGIHGQLLDAQGHDVLGEAVLPEAATVLAQAQRTGESRFRLGRIWNAASPVKYAGTRYTFVAEVHPMRGFLNGSFAGTFADSMVPRLSLGVLVIALFCLLLARHITSPIRVLEEAATQLAGGALGVRAGPSMASRRDELARMANAFDRMAERIQALILAQQEMLGHISHELRSPLTRIGVSLELIRRGGSGSEASSERSSGELDQMQLDLNRLDQMIGQILHITRMDLQQPGERRSQSFVALAPLLESIARDAAFEAQPMQKRVVFAGDPECIVRGDKAMLSSCCENVVRNALLYSPEGTLIQIRLERDANYAIVTVQDQGPGVPVEALPRLFELFYRVNNASQQHPEGTGFGLAIAQKIVVMHGGTIGATNLEPHGLEIRIALPLSVA
jgi:two-component system, OmpR family, sensor histidine kinase CpxA